MQISSSSSVFWKRAFNICIYIRHIHVYIYEVLFSKTWSANLVLPFELLETMSHSARRSPLMSRSVCYPLLMSRRVHCCSVLCPLSILRSVPHPAPMSRSVRRSSLMSRSIFNVTKCTMPYSLPDIVHCLLVTPQCRAVYTTHSPLSRIYTIHSPMSRTLQYSLANVAHCTVLTHQCRTMYTTHSTMSRNVHYSLNNVVQCTLLTQQCRAMYTTHSPMSRSVHYSLTNVTQCTAVPVASSHVPHETRSDEMAADILLSVQVTVKARLPHLTEPISAVTQHCQIQLEWIKVTVT